MNNDEKRIKEEYQNLIIAMKELKINAEYIIAFEKQEIRKKIGLIILTVIVTCIGIGVSIAQLVLNGLNWQPIATIIVLTVVSVLIVVAIAKDVHTHRQRIAQAIAMFNLDKCNAEYDYAMKTINEAKFEDKKETEK